MHKSKVVNTKRERRSSNNKNQNNHHISKQPQTESYSTIGALVTGLTSTQANMSDQTDTLVIKPTSIEINNQSNGTIHENGNHSPSKSLKVKLGHENESEITTTNGHHSAPSPTIKPNSIDHIYETPSNVDHPPPSFETPTVSSSQDEQGNKHDENSQLSSTPPSNEHHLNNGVDSGLSSEMTNATNSGTETEKTNFDDELSSTSILTSSSIISAARLLETNIEPNEKRESSPTSGVIIPEEKRVTDRVKVFEAAANHDQSTVKKQPTKNGHQKKASPNGKHDQQHISPTSKSTTTTESIDTQLINESKPSSTTSKNKSKRPSLKKQIQNLLKIDKPSPDESTIVEEQPTVTNGKKTNTMNSARNKPNNDPTTVNKRLSPSSSQQHSPTNGTDTFKKRSPPPITTNKRPSPRESPSKSQQNSPGSHMTGFNMKPVVEPLEIRIESNVGKKKSPSPSNKVNNNGLLTSELEQRRSSTGVSKLIHTFQGNPPPPSSHDLEQTVLVPRLRSPVQSINHSENVPLSGVSHIDNLVSDRTLLNKSPILVNNTSVPPSSSSLSVTTHSPMSSGVGDSVKTSTRSVSIESGVRTRTNIRDLSPLSAGLQRYGQQETGTSSSYSLLNQSTNAQVTDNLRVQHQREKQELSELNDRFRGYLDRVKVLENKNAKLTGQLEDISKSWGSASQAIISQYSAPLDHLRQEVNESMIDEADLQTRLRRSHYTIDNYRSLINDETAWNDRQEEKREQLKLEYEHSCAELSALQKSYKQVEDQLKNLLKQREDYLSEIDQLNEQSYKATIERIKLDLQVQTLREEIPFLNDVHAHLISEFEQLKPTNGIDTQLFYRQELEKAIRDIRRDFETLHNAQRKEMEDYYNIKIEEIQNDAKKLVPLQSRQDELMKMTEQIKATKFELNDSQKLLINEKDKFKNLQERLSKLEEEYNYVRDQRTDANDAINKDLALAQERIQQLTGEIDTILRSNITLESEINVYRRLLDSETNRISQQPVEQVSSPEPAPPSFGSELGKVFNKKIKKGPIAIKDCTPDGKCITLENSSNDKDVDVSNWILKRRVEGSPEIAYTIPYGLVMKHGSELKIFARSAQNALHRPPAQVVNDKLDSWGMGTECETKLFNEQGEERASHSQKIVFGSESSRNLP
jgi:intermediate filament protein if